jgi:hypothetical protein
LQTGGLHLSEKHISGLKENLMSIPDQWLSHWSRGFTYRAKGATSTRTAHATPKKCRVFRWPEFANLANNRTRQPSIYSELHLAEPKRERRSSPNVAKVLKFEIQTGWLALLRAIRTIGASLAHPKRFTTEPSLNSSLSSGSTPDNAG